MVLDEVLITTSWLGVAVLMFILTLWILLRKRRRRAPQYPFIFSACALMILATSVSA